MKIMSMEIKDVKRIKLVSFQPTLNGLTVIGGRNAQGKTSALSAIAYLLGGEAFRPTNLQREGAEDAPYIRAEMDNGLVIERKGANSALKVTDPTGKKCGQTILNEILTKLALNIGDFINSSDKEKARTLLEILGIEDKLNALDEEENSLYEERHAIGIVANRKKKAAEEMPVYQDVPNEVISTASLVARQQEVFNRNAEINAAKNKVERDRMNLQNAISDKNLMVSSKDALVKRIEEIRLDAERQIEALNTRIASMEAQIATSDTQIAEMEAAVKEAESKDYTLEPTDEIERLIREHEDINVKVRANIARDKCLEEANAELLRYEEYDAKINDVRRRRAALLESANLPYPGLSVRNGVLTLNDKAWDCMSGSQQLTVACAIVSRLKPDCRFVLVDKLEQYDTEQLKALDKWSAENQFQIIGTRVSSGDECSIVIEDGMVKGEAEIVEVAVAGGTEDKPAA